MWVHRSRAYYPIASFRVRAVVIAKVAWSSCLEMSETLFSGLRCVAVWYFVPGEDFIFRDLTKFVCASRDEPGNLTVDARLYKQMVGFFDPC